MCVDGILLMSFMCEKNDVHRRADFSARLASRCLSTRVTVRIRTVLYWMHSFFNGNLIWLAHSFVTSQGYCLEGILRILAICIQINQSYRVSQSLNFISRQSNIVLVVWRHLCVALSQISQDIQWTILHSIFGQTRFRLPGKATLSFGARIKISNNDIVQRRLPQRTSCGKCASHFSSAAVSFA